MSAGCTYTIQILGQITADEINAGSPVLVQVQTVPTGSQISVGSDQSGLIGLIRHLHSLGLTILSVQLDPQ